MAKPTEKQKAIAQIIKNQGAFWFQTNDIESPTHLCDLEEEIRNMALDFECTEEQIENLINSLRDLYFEILNCK